MSCEHNSFFGAFEVTRLTDVVGGPVTGYQADIRIKCEDCGESFIFLGPSGWSPLQPMASIDGLELRCPIKPQSSGESQIDQAKAFAQRTRDPALLGEH